jgi:capsid portal protein
VKEIETLFLQKITEGDIVLYNYRSLKTDKIHSRDYKREYFVEQVTPDGFDLLHVHKGNFREISKELLAANSILIKKLGTSGYGYKYFVKIVKLHNRMMNGEKVEI